MVSRRATRVPLVSKRLRTGFFAIGAVFELEVRTGIGFKPFHFIVDPGAGVTTLPAHFARKNRIPHSTQAIELPVNTAAGRFVQRIYPGYIRIRIPGLPGREFQWPCHFVEGPVGTAHTGLTKPLLGLSGGVNDLRIIFDGIYTQESPHGWAILEEIAKA
jgi:hypothetical protein